MIKRAMVVMGLGVTAALVAACSAAPGDETGEDEQTAESSEALPKCDEFGLCGGGGEYTPYYPYDYGCASGENKYNSGRDCDVNMPCTGGTGCTSNFRCGSNACGSTTNDPSTNPCYGKWVGCDCALSGGYRGHCGYNSLGTLVCKP